jgi:hypothetical protein
MLDRVRAGDVDAVRAVAKTLTETERRRLAPSVIRLLRDVRQAYVGAVVDKKWPHSGEPESVLRSVQVLALGTMTPAELRKAGAWAMPPFELAYEALTNRSIPLADFVDAIADENPTRWNSGFKLMRALVRARLVEQPANPGYILAMINGLAPQKLTVYEALKADPGLMSHEIWRLFEVEGGGEASLATHDKYTSEDQSWGSALTRLSSEGLLSRDRLLGASLAALQRDFAAFRAGWFSRFHESLLPTRDERSDRQLDYLNLVSSSIPATVSFAIRALVDAGGVSDEAVDRLRPALDSKATSTVKGALRLLDPSPRGGMLVAEALPQASRDAQSELVGFLERLPDLEPAVRSALGAAAPNVAPSLRARVAKLAGAKVGAFPAATGGQEPVMGQATLRAPIETLSGLIELLAVVLEGVDNAHEFERALDGTSRLCDRRAETLRRLDPVVRRARKLLATDRSAPFAGVSPRSDFANLILAWTSGATLEVPPLSGRRFGLLPSRTPMPRKSVLGYLSLRVHEVAARAARGQQQPLLSLPTASGGAIDMASLASRRKELQRLRIKPDDADAIQAALRAGEVPAPPEIRFEFGSEVSSHTYKEKTYTHVHFHIGVDPAPRAEPTLADVPGLFIAALSAGGFRRGEADYCGVGSDGPGGLSEAVRWVSTVWPSHREPFYAKGAAELGQNIDWWEARWHVRYFLEPLLLPAEQIGEMARLVIALGLGAKEPGERSSAIDVFVVAIRESRLDPIRLGQVLARLCDQHVVKPGRLASSLGDAGRVSTQHMDAVVRVIETMVAGLHGSPPRDLAVLIAVLSDSLAALEQRLTHQAAIAYLSGIEGSGKAASLAKSLVGVSGSS